MASVTSSHLPQLVSALTELIKASAIGTCSMSFFELFETCNYEYLNHLT